MSVYINMEMPKDCLKCPFCLFADGYWKCLVDGSHADFGGTCRPSLCPLIPVPPHGDLVERQAVLNTFSVHMNRTLHFVTIRDTVPTVIPAEPAEEVV